MPESTRWRSAPRSGGSLKHQSKEQQVLLTIVWPVVLGVVIFALSYPRALGFSMWASLAFASAAVAIAWLAQVWRLPTPIYLPWTTLLLIAWMALSLIWTGNTSSTLAALLLYATLALLAIVLGSKIPSHRLFVGLSLGAGLLLGASVLATQLSDGLLANFSYPMWTSVNGSFNGLYGNRNILAYTVVILLPATLPTRRGNAWSKVGSLALLVACLSVLVMARSATGLIAAALVVLTWGALLALRSMSQLRMPRVRLIAAICATALPLIAGITFADRLISGLGKNIGTLSGRTPLWTAILDETRSEAAVGYGWGAVWNYHWLPAGASEVHDRINASLGSPLGHGHNMALDVLVQVGAVGVALFVVMQVRAVVQLLTTTHTSDGRNDEVTWALLTLLTISIVGITEPMWAMPLAFFLIVLVATLAERHERLSIA